jgi:hypothetical protein
MTGIILAGGAAHGSARSRRLAGSGDGEYLHAAAGDGASISVSP